MSSYKSVALRFPKSRCVFLPTCVRSVSLVARRNPPARVAVQRRSIWITSDARPAVERPQPASSVGGLDWAGPDFACHIKLARHPSSTLAKLNYAVRLEELNRTSVARRQRRMRVSSNHFRADCGGRNWGRRVTVRVSFVAWCDRNGRLQGTTHNNNNNNNNNNNWWIYDNRPE